jgi:hypothetical protein
MGAVVFEDLQVVKGDVRVAYRQAMEDARDYNGHQEGYSGDIQTCDGYREAKGNPRYGTKAFHKWFDEQIDEMDKRECRYIEVTGAVATRLKQRHGFKGRKGIRVFYFFGWGAE